MEWLHTISLQSVQKIFLTDNLYMKLIRHFSGLADKLFLGFRRYESENEDLDQRYGSRYFILSFGFFNFPTGNFACMKYPSMIDFRRSSKN